MDVKLSLGRWHAYADGGTDGGDIVPPTELGPFAERPVLLRYAERIATGPCGERLLTATRVYGTGGQRFTAREQFWLSPDGQRRVKLLETLALGAAWAGEETFGGASDNR